MNNNWTRLLNKQYRYLLTQLVKRDVLLRYRGAYFGLLWVFFSPLIMLAIYAVVFGYVFQARWPNQYQEIPFALLLFAGLIPFNLFAEAVNRAPMAVRSQPNYVKKIIFPVELLPMVPLGAASVQAIVSFLILMLALGWIDSLNTSLILYPVILLPVLLLALGVSWFLASWGVFIKDVAQVVPVLVQMLFFLSPVLYSSSMVPELLSPVFVINPLTPVIEASRALIVGHAVDWRAWMCSLGFGIGVAWVGYIQFRHQCDEFADVL
jgi:lipopolysaccharide transport system permease protein